MSRIRTLKESLVLSHILVSIIPLILITIFLLLFLIKTIKSDATVKLAMLGQGTRGQIQLFMDQPLTVLNNLSSNVAGREHTPLARDLLNKHAENSPYFEAIYLLDRQGRVQEAGLPVDRRHYRAELLGIQLGHKQVFQQAIASGGPQWSDTFLSLASGKISLTLCIPAASHVLAADINLNALSQRISRLSRNSVITMVIDRNGAIIFHPDPAITGQSIMVNDILLVHQALQGTEQTGEFTFGEHAYLGSTSIIAPTGWVALIAEPLEMQNRRLMVPMLILGGGFAAAAALSLGLALYRARSLSRPLTEMSEKSGVIARGDYSATVPRSGFAELEALADNLQRMGRAVEKRENQLLLNQRKYRELVENTSNLVLRLDPSLVLIYANPAFERLSGCPAEVALGRHLADFMTTDEVDSLKRRLAALVADGAASGSLETKINNPGAAPSNLLLTLNIHYSGNGDLEDIDLIGHDITARLAFEQQQRNLEKQRQQSQKMEILGMMASGVAHDLNNILAGIISYPELMLLKMAADDPRRPMIEAIKKSGERAAAVVADLLTIARDSAAVHRVIDINQLISEYCSSPDLENLQAAHPAVTLHCELAENLWCCNCSFSHIEKSLTNLVINAFEAVADRGTVTITTENIPADQVTERQLDLDPGDYLAIRVMDSGQGIAPEHLERIFEPFFSKKELGRSGTGLGLTVAWSCVREHRGTISVQSAPGQGTAFTILLPATASRPVVEASPENLERLYGSGERILIVDDEETLRRVAEEMLSLLGYQPVAVASGEAALAYLENHGADLVLLDMQMDPGLSGKETFERICAVRPQQRALVASGYSHSSEVETVLALGAGGFIKKPYSITELGKAVQDTLGRPA